MLSRLSSMLKKRRPRRAQIGIGGLTVVQLQIAVALTDGNKILRKTRLPSLISSGFTNHSQPHILKFMYPLALTCDTLRIVRTATSGQSGSDNTAAKAEAAMRPAAAAYYQVSQPKLWL